VTVVIDNVTKIINVTALLNWYGNETVVFTATDGVNSTNMSVTIVVVSSVNDNPVVNLTSLQNYNVSEDSSDSTINLSNYVVDVEDVDELINWSCSSNSSDVTAIASNVTKLLNLTASNNFTGTANITCIATDTNGGSGQDSFVLNVTNVNDAPYFDPPITNLTALENVTFIYDTNATDIDPTGDTINFTSNSTLFTINSSTGIVNFTGNSTQVGVYDINFTVCDNFNACQSQTIVLTVQNYINDIIFNVRDRITQTFLDNVTVTGGTTCAAGCTFNSTLSIIEPNGPATYVFTKSGFTSNSTYANITGDLTINVSLDDNQSPVITYVNITPRLSTFNSSYYVDIIVNVSDNFNAANATFTYNLTQDRTESGILNLTKISNNSFIGTLGPYNETRILMNSSVFANDTYGNSDSVINDQVWFMFTGGQLSCSVCNVTNNTMILEFQQGWNLFSVFPLVNTSLKKHLAPLGNGNYGCGHDNTPPFDCNASDGDFVGNWTIIWTQNRSWEYFRPDVYYTLVDNQTLQDLNYDQGYWIYMTVAQNLTIVNN
jgi:hypothetical protein